MFWPPYNLEPGNYNSLSEPTIYKIQIEKWEGCANRRNDILTATTQYGDLGRAKKCGVFFVAATIRLLIFEIYKRDF